MDKDDNIIGYDEKKVCHKGNGLLHRAFSVFIFNTQKELLIQKRSRNKLLWPLFWSNSVCSHPRKGESCEEAARRRVKEELSVEPNLKYLFKFQYQASFDNVGSENEICYIYWGETEDRIKADPAEIDEWRYIRIHKLNEMLKSNPDQFTPWFKIEWELIQKKKELNLKNDRIQQVVSHGNIEK